MKIKIICVGKIKKKWINEGIQDYFKRLKHVEINEIKDLGKEKEAEKILQIINNNNKNNNNNALFIFSEEGQQYDSISFTKKIVELEKKYNNLFFVIGGPDGISEKFKKTKNHIISLSKMTFTHEMARLFLIEQLYRTQAIRQNKNYHR